MIKVAICDNEKIFRDFIEKLITEYMEKHEILYEIETFASDKDLINLGIEIINYTVVFLDINGSELNGIKTAQMIRKISKEIFIVFATACTDYILEGYKVEAIRYLIKESENFQESLIECLDAMIEKINYAVVKKEFKFKEGAKLITLGEILYVESNLHKLEFYVMEDNLRKYTLYETLNKIENKLESNEFIRIHQSFLVNMKYIKSIERYEAILINGKSLAIPKARYKYVKDRFMSY